MFHIPVPWPTIAVYKFEIGLLKLYKYRVRSYYSVGAFSFIWIGLERSNLNEMMIKLYSFEFGSLQDKQEEVPRTDTEREDANTEVQGSD